MHVQLAHAVRLSVRARALRNSETDRRDPRISDIHVRMCVCAHALYCIVLCRLAFGLWPGSLPQPTPSTNKRESGFAVQAGLFVLGDCELFVHRELFARGRTLIAGRPPPWFAPRSPLPPSSVWLQRQITTLAVASFQSPSRV